MTFAYLALHNEPVLTVAARAKGCAYVVAPFASLRGDPPAWATLARDTGAKLAAHVPVSYLRMEYGGDFYDRWKDMYRQGGALKDAAGKPVVLDGMCFLDLRTTGSMKDWCVYYATTLAHHARMLLDTFPTEVQDEPPLVGFFLDMPVDSISWTGATFADPDKTNAAWREGTDRFLRLFDQGTERCLLVGNGNCQSLALDAICYEGWPSPDVLGWTGYIDGGYGTRWHARAHTAGPWVIPQGESPGQPGAGREVAYQAAGFVAGFAPDGVLCVNDPATRAMVTGG